MQDTEVTFNHIKRKLSIKHPIKYLQSTYNTQIMTIMPPKTVKYADGGHLEKLYPLGHFTLVISELSKYTS